MRTFLLSMIGLLVLQIGSAKAQNVVTVNPGFNTLNLAIAAELEKGEEVIGNTVFELERGKSYLLNGSLQNTGYTLSIRAAAGDGARPKLIPAVASGGESERPFRPRGDLNLTGLFITNRDELGKVNTRMIRCSADDITIRLDDCVFDTDNQAAIRLDNEAISIFMKNCLFSNIGIPSDPANGRGVDDRGNDIDSLVIENCTFYNITSRVLRDDGGLLNYCRINHNHFVNIGQRLFSFGEAIDVEFTNNMVVDAGFYGTTTELDYHLIELDSIKQDLIDQGISQKVLLNNNNFFLHSELNEFYTGSIKAVALFDNAAKSFADENETQNTLLNEDVTFENSPIVPTYILDNFWTDPAGTEDWDNTGNPFDFEYASTFNSYAHATDGKPLGDLNWFDQLTGVNDLSLNNNEMELSVFPNPSNGKGKINFKLKKQEKVEIIFLNAMGQRIQNTVSDNYLSGEQVIRFDLSNQPSGIYYCKIIAGNQTSVKQLIMSK